MISERVVVDGKRALVVYLNKDMSPADSKDKAALVKLFFNDGTIGFAVKQDDDND